MLLLLMACTGLNIVPGKSDDTAGVEHTGVDDTEADDTGADDTANDDTGADDTGADDTGADDTGADDTGTTDPTDAERFQEVLDGQRSAADALLSISHSGGWPIDAGDGTFIFAALDQGQASVSLTGDHNGWSMDPMARAGGLWWIRVAIAQPDGSLYKLYDGSAWLADPWARAYGYDSNGEFSLVRGAGGHLERWRQVSGNGLTPRTVRVWVPLQDETHALYVQDGQNLFDPDAIWGGWHLQDALGEHTLVVGIDNTGARMDEYTPVPDRIQGTDMGGLGDDYADFVLDVVRPMIEQEYGIPDRVGAMGSSLGGLISLHMGLRASGDYDFVASMSGTVGWGSIGLHNQTVIEAYDAAGYTGVALYLDSGGGPGVGCVDSDADGIMDDSPDATDNYCENRQLVDLLATEGWTWDQDLWHWWEPGAPHNEAAWAARVARPVALFEAM